MTIKKSINLIAVCAVLVLAATTARADITGTYTGTVYVNTGSGQGDIPVPSSPTGSNIGTFTGTAPFSFVATGSDGLKAFLLSGGATPDSTLMASAEYTGSGQMSNPGLGASSYSTEIVITGTASFFAGEKITISHDDGVVLNLTGLGNVISSLGPNSLQDTSYTFAGAYASNTFTLSYEATNGNPEDLIFRSSVVPEPTSILLFGTALLGISGLLRKKSAKR
jgi:hypothetical protein